jgi:hypothetical protein
MFSEYFGFILTISFHCLSKKGKAVPVHAMEALGGKGG